MAEITIPNSLPRIQYTETVGLATYAYNFPIFSAVDLLVEHTDTNGNKIMLVLTADYTVTGVGLQAGGNVVLNSAALAADTLTISRVMPEQRLTDFVVAGDYRAVDINKELDSHTMMLQQHKRDITRSVTLRTDDARSSCVLPLNTARANKVLAFDLNGDPVAYDITANMQGYVANAASSATNAASSATNAASSAANAAAAASTAATNTSNTITANMRGYVTSAAVSSNEASTMALIATNKVANLPPNFVGKITDLGLVIDKIIISITDLGVV